MTGLGTRQFARLLDFTLKIVCIKGNLRNAVGTYGLAVTHGAVEYRGGQ
ncbi:hypothetical protein AB3X91_09390 [Paraburkholderia sp. BR14263]